MPLYTPLISSEAAPSTTSGGELPKIGYDNLLEQGTVTATTEIANFEAVNAYDWRTATYWKMAAAPAEQFLQVILPTAQPASYFAYFKHDLDEKGNGIQLQYSLNAGADWLDATTEEIPANDRPRFIKFDEVNASHWRVRITVNSTGSILGVISFGQIMEFERGAQTGFSPPGYANKNSYVNNMSESGEFLGRSLIRRGETRTISTTNTTPEWIRNVWQPFAAHAELKPFFFGWDLVGHPVEVSYCIPTGDPKASYSHLLYMQASVQCRALAGNTTNTTPPQQI